MSRKRRRKQQSNIGIYLLLFVIGVFAIGFVVMFLLNHNSNDKKLLEKSQKKPQNIVINKKSEDEKKNTDTSKEAEVKMTFVGDCTFSSVQGSSEFNSYYDQKGASYFFSNVKKYFEADDKTIVNLEGGFTTSTTQRNKGDGVAYWFKAPLNYVDILTSSSVEIANVANNHALDYEQSGLDQTRKTLDDAKVGNYGFDNVYVTDVKGIKFGFFGLAFDDKETDIKARIDSLKKMGAEFIIATFHDGIEKDAMPSDSQKQAAKISIDNGARLVIMHHPHVVQGLTTYKDSLIAFSLGNFCFGGNPNPSDKDSMILQVDFKRDKEGNITYTHNVLPASITSTPGTNDYRPTVLTGSEATRVTDKINERSEGIVIS
ncbi:MAG: CapA family protein [Lachnospiraceae bacterium]|jgi:poly-gamma-glutamate synthesis protein (capsule biosynthesis protein)|nr:CapA family protein [Lachnospiraceae bacterium]